VQPHPPDRRGKRAAGGDRAKADDDKLKPVTAKGLILLRISDQASGAKAQKYVHSLLLAAILRRRRQIHAG
jgi:hypothetical protein